MVEVKHKDKGLVTLTGLTKNQISIINKAAYDAAAKSVSPDEESIELYLATKSSD